MQACARPQTFDILAIYNLSCQSYKRGHPSYVFFFFQIYNIMHQRMQMLHNNIWSSLANALKIRKKGLVNLSLVIIMIFSSRNQYILVLKIDLNSSHHKDYIDHKKSRQWLAKDQNT